jgi:hypothetical protein
MLAKTYSKPNLCRCVRPVNLCLKFTGLRVQDSVKVQGSVWCGRFLSSFASVALGRLPKQHGCSGLHPRGTEVKEWFTSVSFLGVDVLCCCFASVALSLELVSCHLRVLMSFVAVFLLLLWTWNLMPSRVADVLCFCFAPVALFGLDPCHP